MRALSEAQYRAATQGGVPEPERVFGGDGGAELWSVPVAMPGELLGYTLSAILRGTDGALTVVDPGWDAPETHAQLGAALELMGTGIGEIASIVVTHAHPDHLGAAEELRRASGARLFLHEREQLAIERARAANGGAGAEVAALAVEWGVPGDVRDRLAAQAAQTRGGRILPDPADVLLHDGDALSIRGVGWEVLSTPGHTTGHICIVDREHKLLLSGDHVLPTLFPGIGIGVDWGLRDAPPSTAGLGEGEAALGTEGPGGGRLGENPIAQNLASLERLAPFDDFDVLPGHGYRFAGLGVRWRQARAHILKRAGEVAAADDAAPAATIWQLASQLSWSAGWERLSAGPMLWSALLQTSMYRDFVRSGGLA